MDSTSTNIACSCDMASVKKYDLLWCAVLLVILTFLVVPASHEIFIQVSKSHVYLMAFAKFAVLATMGELLTMRILAGKWKMPYGLLWRAAIWGVLGALIALVFYLYATGVSGALKNGLLPSFSTNSFGSKIAFAVFTSTLMNLLFAPTFMAFHRITDTYIEMGKGKLSRMLQLSLTDVLDQVDWNNFIKFVVCKTIPLFWIPAHTITFLLPSEHRVFAAALLSIALGAILAFSKKHGNA